MKISAPSVTLTTAVVLASFFSFACQPAAPPTNRESVNANVTPEKIDVAAIEAELIRLERGWAAAEKNHDANAADQILSDDVIITYIDGSTGTKSDELKVISSGTITADSWELFDPKVRVLNADAAFITGRTVIKNGKQKEPGLKAVNLSGEYRFTDLYLRRNGKWQAVASQTTKILNPAPAPAPSPSPLPSPSTPAEQTPTPVGSSAPVKTP
jgi:hypothetical protein